MSKASTVINKSPRKVRLMVDIIRGVRLDIALETIKSMNKGKTKKLYDVVRSAAHNAKLTDEQLSDYKISKIVVEEAQRLYRVVPRARGSAFRIRRRYSRVKVELEPVKLTK